MRTGRKTPWGAQAPCRCHRHGAVNAERPRLVGSSADDAAARDAADDDRPATQLGLVALLYGRIEGVHVHVQDGG